jgi:KaiC/GvpD/RAD55 family RecA-like ATPase
VSPYEPVAKDLSETERKVLDVLVSNDGKCPLEILSQQAGLTRMRTHRIVARLAAKGIVLVGSTENRKEVQLANWLRMTTGFAGLDNLLLGGIPENYAVVLTSPSLDERQLLIKRFLSSGIKSGQVTFHITIDPGPSKAFVEEFPLDFYLFVCNPQSDVMVKNLPNVFKLKGIESLTDIDIALTKAYRLVDLSRPGPKRACIEILSDVLLQHHAIVTRKWLSSLIPELRSKGFTTMAVLNPQMHSIEEAEAVLGIFEGEIRLTVNQTEKGEEKVLRITRMYHQKYSDNELVLTRQELEISER